MSRFAGNGAVGPTKILFLFSGHGIGGAERSMLRLMERMDSSRFEVRAATVGRQGDLSRAAAERGVDFTVLGSNDRKGKLAVPYRTLRLCRQFRPHILYVFGMRAAYGGGLLAARATGAWFLASERNVRDIALWYWLQRILVTAGGKCIIANSRTGAERLTALGGISPEHIEVVYNGIDAPSVRSRANDAPEVPVRGPGPHLVYVANLIPRKGHGVLFDAVRPLLGRYPDLRVHLLGRDELNGEVQASVENDRSLRGHVEFHGYLSSPISFMSRCDLVVHSSFGEGLPTALLEALACGLPVVTTDAGGTAELIEDGVTGRLVRVGHSELLSRAISDLLADPRLASRLGAAGQARVENHFSLEHMVERHQAIFQRRVAA